MARIRRLRRRPDFLAAAGGRRFHTERMTAQGRLREPDEMRDGQAAEGLHVGLTITKRVGHATERNRIRRRLRAALALLGEDVPDCAADVVLIARRPALGAPFGTLADDLRRALHAVTRQRGARGAKDTQQAGRTPEGEAPPGALPRTEAHVPRRTTPGGRSGHGRGRGGGKAPGTAPGKSTVQATTDG